jgi:hypothetical protein
MPPILGADDDSALAIENERRGGRRRRIQTLLRS